FGASAQNREHHQLQASSQEFGIEGRHGDNKFVRRNSQVATLYIACLSICTQCVSCQVVLIPRLLRPTVSTCMASSFAGARKNPCAVLWHLFFLWDAGSVRHVADAASVGLLGRRWRSLAPALVI